MLWVRLSTWLYLTVPRTYRPDPQSFHRILDEPASTTAADKVLTQHTSPDYHGQLLQTATLSGNLLQQKKDLKKLGSMTRLNNYLKRKVSFRNLEMGTKAVLNHRQVDFILEDGNGDRAVWERNWVALSGLRRHSQLQRLVEQARRGII
jgi:hypothetical protein